MVRNKFPEETVELILKVAKQLFVEKGYDNTSIQDIISNLGGLSKGAIYHHFKSKEEIFNAVCDKIRKENTGYYDRLRDDKTMNGKEKLKTMLVAGYSNPNNEAILAMTEKILNDPKFVMNQVLEIYELVAPRYIQPIIQQGIDDGSIKIEYPKELAEVLATLTNIWVNPVLAKADAQGIRRKVEFFKILLEGLGLDIIDQETIDQYAIYGGGYKG